MALSLLSTVGTKATKLFLLHQMNGSTDPKTPVTSPLAFDNGRPPWRAPSLPRMMLHVDQHSREPTISQQAEDGLG